VVVGLFLNKFRSHVKRSSFDAGENYCIKRHQAGKPEITEFYDSSSTDEYVLRFHISMYYSVFMEIVKSIN
jgi:hypothetical protein